MAEARRRRTENVAGDLFVDDTCIDCDTCRWMAPETFDRVGEQSRVHTQPADEATRHRALMALLACPTASIGSASHAPLAEALAAFPDSIAGGVHHCGFHSEDSFGATSYFVARPGGNLLVDCPRFAGPLVRRLEELGGVARILLTHRDDVADHERFARHFGAERVLHADDVTADTAGVERQPAGQEPLALDDDLLLLPTPGHTRGSACFLYQERFLFTGDHLAWSDRLGQLYAFRSACWYDWDVQRQSMARLAAHHFEWVLPGHGRRCRVAPGEQQAALQRCLEWMAAP